MQKFEDVYIENDKKHAPLLLAASFQGKIKYLGSVTTSGVLYWKFSPKIQAIQLIDQFKTKTEPHIPARDLFEAVDTFWQQVRGVK